MSKILLFIALILAGLWVHAQAELHDDTLLIEGEVQRTVLGKKNIERSDLISIVSKFKIEIDSNMYLFTMSSSEDSHKSKHRVFSDGEDGYALINYKNEQFAAISEGVVPSGGTGFSQTLWFVFCRPFYSTNSLAYRQCGDLNLQRLVSRSYSNYIEVESIMNKSTTYVREIKAYTEEGERRVMCDHFEFADYADAGKHKIPKKTKRTVFAQHKTNSNPRPIVEYVISVNKIDITKKELVFPSLKAVSKVVDFRFVENGGETGFVEYESDVWRTKQDLIADQKILSKINNIRNRAKSQKKKYREEINVKFALYVVMSLLLLALIVFIKAPKQQN